MSNGFWIVFANHPIFGMFLFLLLALAIIALVYVGLWIVVGLLVAYGVLAIGRSVHRRR